MDTIQAKLHYKFWQIMDLTANSLSQQQVQSPSQMHRGPIILIVLSCLASRIVYCIRHRLPLDKRKRDM